MARIKTHNQYLGRQVRNLQHVAARPSKAGSKQLRKMLTILDKQYRTGMTEGFPGPSQNTDWGKYGITGDPVHKGRVVLCSIGGGSPEHAKRSMSIDDVFGPAFDNELLLPKPHQVPHALSATQLEALLKKSGHRIVDAEGNEA